MELFLSLQADLLKLEVVNDFTAPLEQCGIITMAAVDQNFQHQGLPDPWAPLALSTLVQRRENGKDAQILMDSGTLRRSWQRGGDGNVYESDGVHVTIGTNIPYAPFQEYGTKPYDIFPKEKKALWWPGLPHPVPAAHHPGLVARPFGHIAQTDVDDMGTAFVEWLGATL